MENKRLIPCSLKIINLVIYGYFNKVTAVSPDVKHLPFGKNKVLPFNSFQNTSYNRIFVE